jgi:predicted dehydrogenase
MAAQDPFTLRWGIMATGGIADLFARDLLKDPATRDVHDVAHIVQAVAASSSLDKAQKFADQITEGKPHSISSYGSYKELVEDPKVDIIYVATPHSHHYECTLLALRAGKHVCCEVGHPP